MAQSPARWRRLAILGVVATAGTLVATPANASFAGRFVDILTDNCNDPANPTTGAPAGLCQANNPNQPGGNNPQVLTARIVLVDDGITLKGVGRGTGFVFGRTYVSLLYLNPTVQTCARFPANQQALAANTANADNDFNSMFLGVWTVQPDGTGTMEVYPGKASPLGNPAVGGQRGLPAYGTASIREAAGGFAENQAGAIANNIANRGADVPPNVFALRACGSLVRTFDTPS